MADVEGARCNIFNGLGSPSSCVPRASLVLHSARHHRSRPKKKLGPPTSNRREAGAASEVLKRPGSEDSFTALDVFAGARYWNMSTQVQFDITGNVDFSRARLVRFDFSRNAAVADSGTLEWVDPLIGLRLRHQFTANQSIMAR